MVGDVVARSDVHAASHWRGRGGELVVVGDCGCCCVEEWRLDCEVSFGGGGVLGIGVGVLESGFFGRCDSSAIVAGGGGG